MYSRERSWGYLANGKPAILNHAGCKEQVVIRIHCCSRHEAHDCSVVEISQLGLIVFGMVQSKRSGRNQEIFAQGSHIFEVGWQIL